MSKWTVFDRLLAEPLFIVYNDYITSSNGDTMKIGDLYRVKKKGHRVCQLGDLIVITGYLVGSGYIKGINTKTGKHHHYLKDNLEKL